ncbi:hypothetical protein EXN22_25465 [Pseudomonas tructae]|uniref:EamA domain-containing protein n=1 Tax=Pseudomonas tructae TaxID=2518644 RepID=A0A411MQD3_9PSED|nr:EamA family transporter [Pseudomonas tructae]QBF28870.1 hypothetical protein EXN22_25465 [Pseudomonas tructae]
MSSRKIATRDVIVILLVALLWGANFSFIGTSLGTVDPYMLTALRFFFCVFPLIFFLRKPQAVGLKFIALYGLLFGAGMAWLLNLGIAWGVNPGIASLLLQFSAFFTVGWGVMFFGEKLNRIELGAIALALVGLGLVIHTSGDNLSITGVLFVLLAALCWSLCNIIIKLCGLKDAFAFLVWSCLFAIPALFLATYLVQGPTPFVQLFKGYEASAYFSIMYQAYISTLLGYWVWNKQMHKYPVSQIAPYSILVPIWGLVISWWVFEESTNAARLAAIGLTLSALALFISARRLELLMGKTTQLTPH